ncbi:hypothetical protein BD310DRAFT_612985 [Dichomitus squalens]|uniref:Uncharacterized protein n=1 Tax=Dichomitus squalens TaxID=114155 RepID=A0A4Q9PQ25_9APHY|nr:hypothetical protein BD310DRAFT_612985 [Dichomitus squalens]
MRLLVYILLPLLAFFFIARLTDVSLFLRLSSFDLRLVSYIIPFSSVSPVYPLSLGLLHRPFYHVPIPLTLCIYNAFLDVATLLVHCWHTWRTLLFRFAVCFQSFRDDHAIKCI